MGEEAAEAEGERPRPLSAIDRFPRDLLRRLDGNVSKPDVTGGDSDELELNLGLSLGGCFGMDNKGMMLVRSSSIASFSVPAEHDFPTAPPTIARASSLPTESEQERRKRKELQSLKRFEVKRKRLEKRNSIRPGAARSDEDAEVGRSWRAAVMTDGSLELQIGSQSRGVFKADSSPTRPGWSAGTRSSAAPPADAPGSFLSIPRGSLGGNGGSFSKFEFQKQMPAKEINTSLCCSKRDANRTTKVISVDEATNTVPVVRKSITAVREEDSLKKVTPNVTNLVRSTMGEMPFVSTMGDGPNGRRVEGFLYKYRKGEEVRIVCVCHGSFLTPAEFVKHAGGGDVAHPLRHIVVNPCPSALL